MDRVDCGQRRKKCGASPVLRHVNEDAAPELAAAIRVAQSYQCIVLPELAEEASLMAGTTKGISSQMGTDNDTHNG